MRTTRTSPLFVLLLAMLTSLAACQGSAGQSALSAAAPNTPVNAPGISSETVLSSASPQPDPAPMPAGSVSITFNFTEQSGYASNQFAVWIEDSSGSIVKTLYATRFTAEGGYKNRPDSIPVWVEKSNLPAMEKAEADTITGATPKAGSLSYVWDLTDINGIAVPADKYSFFVEGSLRWKNRVLYNGVIDTGGTPASVQGEAVYTFEGSDGQPALDENAGETGMITAVTAVFAPAAGTGLPAGKPEGVSQIYVRRNTDGTDGGFQTLIEMMAEYGEPFYQTSAAPNGMIRSNDAVLLFYNGQWDGRGGTNTDLINAVAEAVAAHPDGFTGEIIIADSGQGDGSLDHARPNSKNRDQSVLDVVNKQKDAGVKITGYLWDDIMDIRVSEYSSGDDNDGYVLEPGVSESTKLAVSYPKFTTDYGTKISIKHGIWNGTAYDNERLKLIGMPVLKSHGTYQATAAVKKYMGMPSQNISAGAGGSPHNSVGLGGMGEMMAKSRMPVLNILDMIYIGSRGGPWVAYDEASEYFAIAAGTDPFALDYWAVKNVLMPEAEAVGNRNAEYMNPDSDMPGSFGYWMNLALDEVEKAGFSGFIFGEESVQVYEK